MPVYIIQLQHIPTIIHIVWALLSCGTHEFYPFPSGLLDGHWGNDMIVLVPVKQPWRLYNIHPEQKNSTEIYIFSLNS